MNKISQSIVLKPRDEHFEFAANGRRDWHGGDPVKSIIYNAFSIMFPEGERFFMNSVRNYRAHIKDPILKQQVKGFLTQEAMHTREHVMYNKQLDEMGFSATRLHNSLKRRLRWMGKHFSNRRQLAATCALEHYTAMMSDLTLSDPSFLEGADESYKKAWIWHAIEETEHKGVAFDVMESVSPKGWTLLRIRTMIIVTLVFNYYIFKHIAVMLNDIGKGWSPRAWGQVFWFFFGKPGLFRRMFRPWMDYFKPSFHPWDHDNRDKIGETERLYFDRESTYSV